MKLFISWSGKNSKALAKGLKTELLNIFENEDTFSVFMSDEDILSGEIWFQKIKMELAESDCVVLCITKENINAPWIYFEAGAITMKNNSKVISLVFDTTIEKNSPLTHFQSRPFDEENYYSLFDDIRAFGNYTYKINSKNFEVLVNKSYKDFRENISSILEKLKISYLDDNISIYPNEQKVLSKNVLFLSSPMASLQNDEYVGFRNEILEIKTAIERKCSGLSIYYSGENISKPEKYDGDIKAIGDNFKILKECEYILFIYPKRVPTSSFVEIGYGIALSKKIIIFAKRNREILPYLLRNADRKINNITIYEYKKYTDIISKIEKNGMALFM